MAEIAASGCFKKHYSLLYYPTFKGIWQRPKDAKKTLKRLLKRELKDTIKDCKKLLFRHFRRPIRQTIQSLGDLSYIKVIS
jgi:hypothetical protein